MEPTSMKNAGISMLLMPGVVIKYLVKFWLEPEIELEKRGEFNEQELNEIRKLIVENKEVILSQLNLFYQGKPVKAIRK